MKILIIDDEVNIRRILGDYLRKKGFETVEGKGGYHGIEMAIEHKDVDLILLDIRMPKLDGYETIKELKEVTDAPVIFLTALNESFDEVKGLEHGADDYISKPFSYEVLLARINSCLKKHNKINDHIVEHEGLKLDFKNKTMYINNAEVILTQMEFELLAYLYKNKNMNIERQRILDRIWGYDYYGDPRTVDTHVKTLRSKLSDYSIVIKTIRGVGYKLDIS